MKLPPETEGFEELQKLLAMKRHEVPPPRFFNDFADRVLTRLADPEPPSPPTWRQRLGLDFDFKPALVCASGVGLCVALLLGLFASLSNVVPRSAPAPVALDRHPLEAPSPDFAGTPPNPARESSDIIADFRRVNADYYPSSRNPSL